MARKTFDRQQIGDLYQRYLAGESLKELCGEIGECVPSIYTAMKRFGFLKFRSKIEDALLKSSLSRAQIAELSQAGASVWALSEISGIGRGAIRTILSEANVQLRTGSDAMKLRWERADVTERGRMLLAAHTASKGRVVPRETKLKIAASKEGKVFNESASEKRLAKMLKDAGVGFSRQRAAGIYNIDFALEEDSIAVEVFGGNWHGVGCHLARFHERTKHLLDSGWHVTIVWSESRRNPLGTGCVNYLVSQIERVRGNPSSLREYRVILGDGKPSPILKTRLNTVADIERLGSRCQFSERDD